MASRKPPKPKTEAQPSSNAPIFTKQPVNLDDFLGQASQSPSVQQDPLARSMLEALKNAGPASTDPNQAIYQQATNFINALKNSGQLTEWQNRLSNYNLSATNTIPQYIKGQSDQRTLDDTFNVYQTMQVTGMDDPWNALNQLTTSAQQAVSQQNAIDLANQQAAQRAATRAPMFQPAADASVRTAVQSGFGRALGRNPTDQEAQHFISEYRNLEARQYNQTASSDMSSTGGGTVQQAPTPQALVENEENNAPEAVGYRALQISQKLAQLIGGGV